jgi:type IV pilus assembly protein PilN
MRFPVNLASEPFRRDRPMVVGTIAVSVLLVILLGIFISLAISERNRAKEARGLIAKVDGQLRTISTEQSKLEAVLRKPENAEVLDRSVFTNQLLLRKGVSWTLIFNDLEKVLPHDVRLVSVRPQLNGPNDLLLDMEVGTQNGEAFVPFIMNLEKSLVFGSTTLLTSRPPSQSDPLYRFRVSVTYAQKL